MYFPAMQSDRDMCSSVLESVSASKCGCQCVRCETWHFSTSARWTVPLFSWAACRYFLAPLSVLDCTWCKRHACVSVFVRVCARMCSSALWLEECCCNTTTLSQLTWVFGSAVKHFNSLSMLKRLPSDANPRELCSEAMRRETTWRQEPHNVIIIILMQGASETLEQYPINSREKWSLVSVLLTRSDSVEPPSSVLFFRTLAKWGRAAKLTGSWCHRGAYIGGD